VSKVNDGVFGRRRYLIPFRSGLLPQVFCDVLVIGSGVGGLRAAIEAAGLRAGGADVILLCKDEPQLSNTAWAQGGIASVTDAGDTLESHISDTLTAGAGLCDEAMVRRVISAGPTRIKELLDWGIRFDRDVEGRLKLGLEGGHSLSRILHADGDATGRELFRCLWERCVATAGVRVFTKCFCLDLITSGAGEGAGGGDSGAGAPVVGAVTHHPKHGLQVIWAKATILASGGAGMIYRETSNPRTATGDGLAAAYRAGAAMADMAFVQFHPTCLYMAGAPRSLITEAVRGEGGVLVDEAGERFMPGVHPQAELAPRDVVTKGIVQHLSARGGERVFLDARRIAGFAGKFPGIAQLLARYDLDAARDLIPVHPGQHYTIGGVLTDGHGRTNLPGLYAVGEVACSGLHGANRLASNSLLEGLVMGQIAGEAARERLDNAVLALRAESLPEGWSEPARSVPVSVVSEVASGEASELDLEDAERSLRSCMWRNVGIERSGPRLAGAVEMIDLWAKYTLDKVFDEVRAWQLQNMLTVSMLTARSALAREESRGCHWRTDFPDRRAELVAHDVWSRGRAGPRWVGIR